MFKRRKERELALKKQEKREKIEKIKAEEHKYACVYKWNVFNINKNSFNKYIKITCIDPDDLFSVIIQVDFIDNEIFTNIQNGEVIICCINDLLKKAMIENFKCEII